MDDGKSSKPNVPQWWCRLAVQFLTLAPPALPPVAQTFCLFNFGFFWAVRKVGEVWVEDDNVRPLLRRITEGYIEGEGGEGLCHLRYSYHIESE